MEPRLLDLAPWIGRVLVETCAFALLLLLLERWVLRGPLAISRHMLWLLLFARLLMPGSVSAEVGAAVALAPVSQPGLQIEAALSGAAGLPAGTGTALLALWALGAAALLIRLIRRARGAAITLDEGSWPAPAEIQGRAQRIAMGLRVRTPLRVRLHGGAAPALLVGLRRPVLLLSSRLSRVERDAALRHECMHLRRRDAWVQLALELVHVVWWFHPLLPLCKSRARDAREVACDQAVVRRLKPKPRARYHHALLEQAQRALAAPASAALAFVSGPCELVVRLESLGATHRRRHRLLAGALPLVAAALLTLAACGQAASTSLASWYTNLESARAETARCLTTRPGEGCTHGRLVFLRALALEAERAKSTNNP